MTNYLSRILASAGMLIGILAAFCGSALAHDPRLSAAEIRIVDGQVFAEVSFAAIDLERVQHVDLNNDGVISDQELKSAAAELVAVAGKLLDIECAGRRIGLQDFRVEMRDGNSVHFLLQSAKENAAGLQFTAPILKDLPRGHKQFLSVRGRKDEVLGERMLSAESQPLSVDLQSTDASAGLRESILRFVTLGIEHILTGYDHLAFLLAVLLAGGSLRSNVKIITSFTIAHSLTLAFATLGLVRIPPSVVEPLIAVSIIFVGVENLMRRRFAERWLVTFGFGLIHGLGFASVLRDLGIGANGVGAAAIPLVAFNIGVELAQIAIAVSVLPLIWKLQQRPMFALKQTPALSALIVIAGVYWFVARTLV